MNTNDETSDTSTSIDAALLRIPLNRFCQDLSLTDRRVEMIAAFHYTEKKAGRTHDTADAYKARYIDFATATPQ